jgi:hypothetical protein
MATPSEAGREPHEHLCDDCREVFLCVAEHRPESVSTYYHRCGCYSSEWEGFTDESRS